MWRNVPTRTMKISRIEDYQYPHFFRTSWWPLGCKDGELFPSWPGQFSRIVAGTTSLTTSPSPSSGERTGDVTFLSSSVTSNSLLVGIGTFSVAVNVSCTSCCLLVLACRLKKLYDEFYWSKTVISRKHHLIISNYLKNLRNPRNFNEVESLIRSDEVSPFCVEPGQSKCAADHRGFGMCNIGQVTDAVPDEYRNFDDSKLSVLY